jgi:hypothetical protein
MVAASMGVGSRPPLGGLVRRGGRVLLVDVVVVEESVVGVLLVNLFIAFVMAAMALQSISPSVGGVIVVAGVIVALLAEPG